jgi:hypothetical protein
LILAVAKTANIKGSALTGLYLEFETALEDGLLVL